MESRYLILDRDGVINFDSDDYIKSPDEWEPIPGSLEAIAQAQHAGWSIAVATNQSGIGRGLFNERTLDAIHEKLHHELAKLGAHIELIAWCPHLPEAGCDCRKPKPGLYRQIAERWGIDLEGVPVIGDSLRDLQAAQAVKARPLLVRTGNGRHTERLPEAAQVPVFDDLQQAIAALLE